LLYSLLFLEVALFVVIFVVIVVVVRCCALLLLCFVVVRCCYCFVMVVVVVCVSVLFFWIEDSFNKPLKQVRILFITELVHSTTIATMFTFYL